jgi:hypothetical protein
VEVNNETCIEVDWDWDRWFAGAAYPGLCRVGRLWRTDPDSNVGLGTFRPAAARVIVSEFIEIYSVCKIFTLLDELQHPLSSQPRL